MEIIPAILPKNFKEIEEKVAQVAGLSSTVQIDLVDGIYAPNQTWPFNEKDSAIFDELMNEERAMPYWDTIDYEFDLMIKDSDLWLDRIARLGAKRIIFHLKSIKNPVRFF